MRTEKQKWKASEIESSVRQGDLKSASIVISKINRNRLSRSELVQYANIANRVHNGQMAHRLLEPLMRSDRMIRHSLTDLEKVEYAESLRIMGLTEEAKELLLEINSDQVPLVNLRIAFCLVSQWQYDLAIPYLQRFLSQTDRTDYLSFVARVNLAAAFVIERKDAEAIELLNGLKVETRKNGYKLLYGNCLELTAQLCIYQMNFDAAEQAVIEAEIYFRGEQSKYSLYLMKWKSILKCFRAKSVDPELSQCRERAIEEGDWETVRECDLYIGFFSQDSGLLKQVYFGTRFESYRKRICQLVGDHFSEIQSFVWLQSAVIQPVEIFDLLQGRLESQETGLEVGRLPHRLLIVLASDFYRPVSIAKLFSALFPDEHFRQQGSKNHVSQILKRLRDWLKEQGSFLSVEEVNGLYSLKISPGYGIRVPRDLPLAASNSILWAKVSKELSGNPFTKSDLVQTLQISAASANRLLRWALSIGLCEARGAGTQRKYILKK